MNCSTPGLPVHHQLPEFTRTHVHRVGDAIQPSHPLSSPSPPAPNTQLRDEQKNAWSTKRKENKTCKGQLRYLEAVKGDGLGEELDSPAPSDFPHGSKRFTKAALRHEVRTRESEEPILWDIAGHPSSWVGRSERKRDRESGNGEQRRGRTDRR